MADVTKEKSFELKNRKIAQDKVEKLVLNYE